MEKIKDFIVFFFFKFKPVKLLSFLLEGKERKGQMEGFNGVFFLLITVYCIYNADNFS